MLFEEAFAMMDETEECNTFFRTWAVRICNAGYQIQKKYCRHFMQFIFCKFPTLTLCEST